MRYQIIVEFSLPHEIRGSTREFREFVEDALESWGGQRHPDDWLFNSLQNVKVLGIVEMKRK